MAHYFGRAALVAVLVAGQHAGAWQEPSPEPKPAGQPPVQPGPARRPQPEPIKPTGSRPEPKAKSGTIPGLEDANFLVGAAGLRSEGTFLVEKRGSMIRLPTGERVFVFHAEKGVKHERPMVLVACQRLQQMEQMAAEEPTVFVLTGQVFVYAGVNYLLPTMARQVGLVAPAEGTPKPGGAAAPGITEPGVQDLIRQLEAQREQPRGPEARPVETHADAAQSPALPEGQMVVRRRGRLVRLAGGEWALAFDSGSAGDTKLDQPMTISPCLNLQRMEVWAMRSGDAASFEVSGRVLAYQGRNHLIPTMIQVYPVNELEAKH